MHFVLVTDSNTCYLQASFTTPEVYIGVIMANVIYVVLKYSLEAFIVGAFELVLCVLRVGAVDLDICDCEVARYEHHFLESPRPRHQYDSVWVVEELVARPCLTDGNGQFGAESTEDRGMLISARYYVRSHGHCTS